MTNMKVDLLLVHPTDGYKKIERSKCFKNKQVQIKCFLGNKS